MVRLRSKVRQLRVVSAWSEDTRSRGFVRGTKSFLPSVLTPIGFFTYTVYITREKYRLLRVPLKLFPLSKAFKAVYLKRKLRLLSKKEKYGASRKPPYRLRFVPLC